jgi:tRNA pseudouridine synthase 10
MKNIKSTQVLVNSILRNYSLCNYCLGRLISKNLCLKPSQSLGKKFNTKKPKLPLKKCYICKNIFQKIDNTITHMLEQSSSYQFSTFLVGLIIKPSISDNDDDIKSKFKIKGTSNVKTQINHELSKKFAYQTKSKTDIIDADIIFKINFKDDSCKIYSKPMFVYGRYTKEQRNLPQKQISCKNCLGKGCISCSFHGLNNFNSVEGKIAKLFYKKFNSKQIKINWIGGEDKSSLISGNGRPFFVKILDPHIRKLKFQKQNYLNGIQLHDLRIIQNSPKNPISFRSNISILLKSEIPLKNILLKKIHSIKNSPLKIYNYGEKFTEKSIYDIKYKKSNSNLLQIFMLVDSGFPIKSFVENSNIKPNLSELLETKCTCIQFDFKEINVICDTSKN